jgi:hypothetical protein
MKAHCWFPPNGIQNDWASERRTALEEWRRKPCIAGYKWHIRGKVDGKKKNPGVGLCPSQDLSSPVETRIPESAFLFMSTSFGWTTSPFQQTRPKRLPKYNSSGLPFGKRAFR